MSENNYEMTIRKSIPENDWGMTIEHRIRITVETDSVRILNYFDKVLYELLSNEEKYSKMFQEE